MNHNNEQPDIVRGYEIIKAATFENGRGVALAFNPSAVQPYVTWMFTESESGERDYEWGFYSSNKDVAESHYKKRIEEYIKDFRAFVRDIYPGPTEANERQNFSAQRPEQSDQENYRYYAAYPLDLNTFPKTPGGPISLEPFDKRRLVDNGTFQAWGILTYNEPLCDTQLSKYELRAMPENPSLTYGQFDQLLQAVGKYEKSKHIKDIWRLTWWHSDFGVFVKKDFATANQISARYNEIMGETK